jgi:two-component system cell cycle sensor histidine kinase/response regulator CckA
MIVAQRPGVSRNEIAVVVLAALASALLIQLATGSIEVTLAYVGGLAVLGLGGWAAMRRRGEGAGGADALPDWSVTASAIEQAGVAIAITDRANRLLCANSAFENGFGSANAPPRLPLGAQAVERLTDAARAAWRDGASAQVALSAERGSWIASARRAGAGEEHLVWRFEQTAAPDPLAQIRNALTGTFGPILSAAGIETALAAPDGAILAASEGFTRRASGDPRADLTGQNIFTLLNSDEQDRIYFAREGQEGRPQALVPVPLSPSSAGQATEPTLMLLLDGPTCLAGWNADSAPSVQLEPLLAQLPLGLAMTDRDGRFLFANPAFLRAARVAGSQLPPYPSDLVVRQDKAAMVDAVRRYAQGAPSSGDITVRLRADPDESVSLGFAGVRGMGEAAVLLSMADSTEETRLRRQVAQATKMQAVGQLAGGVAHDFNNVLTAIIGYCDLMLLRHLPGDSDYDDIQQIKANSNRAASLTRQLLAFSRQQTLQPQILQLPDVMAEVSQLLKRLLGATITLSIQHDRGLGPVRADPRQLEQVIVNLAVNARDAIQTRAGAQARGRLTFATRQISATDVRRTGNEIIPPGEYTALIAEDTGGGIPQKHLGKIFEPFFTTKEQGKGTGLGLSTVYGIVKQSGGFIFADNIEHPDGAKGARFTLYLPVYHASEEELRKAEREREREPEKGGEWSGGGRILLVEDEDMVRAVAERALTRQGYTVVTAADGEEGLAVMREDPEFDLVVTDVVMPTMDGPAMARAIREIAPDMPVLFMSGYAESQLRDEIDIERMHFIPKPFSVAQIVAKVGDVLRAELE